MSWYTDLLKDPRWQKRRLRVLERADWACYICGCTTRTLHVHHRRYVAGRKPWEYGDEELYCLCVTCHARQSAPNPPPLRPRLTLIADILPDVMQQIGLCVVCFASYAVDGVKCADCRYNPFDPAQQAAEFPDASVA